MTETESWDKIKKDFADAWAKAVFNNSIFASGVIAAFGDFITREEAVEAIKKHFCQEMDKLK